MLDSQAVLDVPYATADLPGIGGQLRATPDHFVVEEVPLYQPEGEGLHLYVNLTKVGLTTKDVQRRIERLLGLRAGEVGYAGLKDRQARTTQTFSICIEHHDDAYAAALVQRIQDEVPVTVNWAKRHRNKLKPGHLLGNRFVITITELALPAAEIEKRASAIGERLLTRGLPNYFGPQRFGAGGTNVANGLALLLGQQRVPDRWLRRFLISSLQSALCNLYLARRLEAGLFDQLLTGDVAKKYETGGMFDVVALEQEQPRYERLEISFTAPLYGSKMWPAKAESGELEAAILAEAGLTLDDFQRVRVDGSRRLGRLKLSELSFQPVDAGVEISFFLPKGAFATTVLRELMKVEPTDAPEVDGEESA
jgi:tRNA pseudouridine13 synthase